MDPRKRQGMGDAEWALLFFRVTMNARTMHMLQPRKKRVSAPGTQVQKGACLPPLGLVVRESQCPRGEVTL